MIDASRPAPEPAREPDRRMSIVVEGWQGAAQSYAIIAHQHMRALSRRDDVDVFFRPVAMPFAADGSPRLGQPVPDGLEPDILYRIHVPLNLTPGRARRTLVYATCDYFHMEQCMLPAGCDFAAAARQVHLITPSMFSKAGMLQSGALDERVHVVPNGFDPAVFHPAAPTTRQTLRHRFGWTDRLVCLNVSAMTVPKAIDTLIIGFAQLLVTHPQAILALKGSDRMYQSDASVRSILQDATERLNLPAELERRIVYIGDRLDEAMLAELYQAADVYVSPYRAEGFNMPVLEAAACGLPIVATAGGPTDEFTTPAFNLRVRAEKHPAVWTKRDPESHCLFVERDHLVKQMGFALDTPDWRRDAGAIAARHVADRYNWDRVTDDLVTRCRALLAE
jgi:glycosyltransferase involved in cell wall biosynthesis